MAMMRFQLHHHMIDYSLFRIVSNGFYHTHYPSIFNIKINVNIRYIIRMNVKKKKKKKKVFLIQGEKEEINR